MPCRSRRNPAALQSIAFSHLCSLHFSRLSQMPACQTWSFSEANAVCWENLHTLSDNNPRLDLNANIHNIDYYILPTHFFTVAATAVSLLHYLAWYYFSPHQRGDQGMRSDRQRMVLLFGVTPMMTLVGTTCLTQFSPCLSLLCPNVFKWGRFMQLSSLGRFFIPHLEHQRSAAPCCRHILLREVLSM